MRVKIIALLAALAALWSFAAYVTVQDGLNMLSVNTIGRIGFATSAVADAIQVERRLSVVALSGDNGAVQDELVASRTETDELLAAWRDEAGSQSLEFAASDQLMERIEQAGAAQAQLGELRARVDDGDLEPNTAVAEFSAIIDAGFDIYVSMASLDDEDIARQLRALIALARGRELMSQEHALLAGVLTAGQVTSQDIAEFTKLVGAQRFQYDNAVTGLHPTDLALYEQAVTGPAVTTLRTLEDRFIEEARPGAPPPLSTGEWHQAVESAAGDLQSVELTGTDNVVARATPVAIGVIVRLILAGGLGLITVVAAVIVSVTTARALVRQLERLRDAARDLATNRLPRVVERLSTGEMVDVTAEAPPLRFGDDEIGQVGQAFNAVQETAVRAAVQQAELRHGVRDVFLALARRTQNLVHKQLSVVDGMERRETDADEMEELYRIDHLATRMRRNAENLIVLAGSSPGRVWRRPVPMVDVVRGAIAEVEDYQRVNLMPVQGGALEGRVAGDVIHLLAELIENAASFSPPYAKVSVAGQRVAHGFVVEIEDRGLGITESELATVNRKLAEPPDFSLADASRLGHYVVAKLAQRHGIRVHLRTSPYGGVTAIVLIPKEIMLEAVDDEPVAVSAAPATPTPPAIPAGPAPSDGASAHVPNGAGGGDTASTVVVVRQARPMETRPIETRPMETRPMETRPMETRPMETQPVEGRPAADRPVESRPVESRPVESRPVESRPMDGAPADRPVEGAPEGTPRTPSGLPWRVRQASLPKQLWNEDDLGDEPLARDPEQVRQAMRSFQIGTQRGRSDAEDSDS